MAQYITASKISHACPSSSNGLVDLGYAKHIPTHINTTASGERVAIYKNIRFANAPAGNLRFRKPDTNLPVQDGVQDGKASMSDSTCISTAPWMVPFPSINGTSFGVEDCLFLDVYVPQGVKPGDGVPVLHWFTGSAYAFGGKEYFISPLGLFDRIKAAGLGKFIFVANNYRRVLDDEQNRRKKMLTKFQTRGERLYLLCRPRHGCKCWAFRFVGRGGVDSKEHSQVRR